LLLKIKPPYTEAPESGASRVSRRERERNHRGLFAIGPQYVGPSDVLAAMIDSAKLALSEAEYAPSDDEVRRARKKYKARRAVRRLIPGSSLPHGFSADFVSGRRAHVGRGVVRVLPVRPEY
jgi:hypothetical protein